MHVADVEPGAGRSSHWEALLGIWQGLELAEGWQAEIIEGGLFLVTPPQDAHNRIVADVQKQLYREILRDGGAIADCDVHQAIDLRIPSLLSLYIPDLAVLPGPLDERGEDHSAADALIVVEVASPSTAERDRKAKLWGYAHGPVPLYLLIDRWDPLLGEPAATLYSEPLNGTYADVHKVRFGEPVALPEPFGFALDTSRFPVP
ncbi:Uma2 family endonuclease [Nocardiopsis sp. CNT-189]|uniref:Uma2 family endonuclease n=1 Tax=Nocardiopsis oceanisediminis TaxID=2816862 RepID=UPI003B2F6F58